MKKLYTILLLTIGLSVYSQQQISPLNNGCASSPFNLTIKSNELLAGQNPNEVIISYFDSLTSAQSNVNQISNPTSCSYNVATSTIFIFARILTIQTNAVVIKSFQLQSPPPLSVSTTNTGTIITATGNGGMPPYQYSLNGSAPQTSGNFPVVAGSSYIISVMDANGCSTTTSLINTSSAVDAVDDVFNVVTTPTQGAITPSIVDNDFPGLIGHFISFPQLPTGFTGNLDGTISIASTVANGTYSFQYTYCSMLLFQNHCDSAMVTINVNAPSVVNAVDDDFSNQVFTTQIGGITPSVTNNDTLNGAPFTSPPFLSLGTVKLNGNPLLTTVVLFSLNTQGQLIVPQGLQAGTYTITYNACQWNNPLSNCDPATITIVVKDVLEFSVNGTYIDTNADGFTNLGDSISYQFTVKNNGTSPITNISIVQSGLNIVGSPILTLAAGVSNNTNFSAVYSLTQADINNNIVTKSAVLQGTYNNAILTNSKTKTTQLNISSGLKLQAFIDSNNNGIKDNNEVFFTSGNFNLQINGVQNSVIASTGIYYAYESVSSTVYNLSYTVTGQYASQYVTTANYNNVTVSPNSGITTYNFPISVLPFTDLTAVLFQFGPPPRPGFTYRNRILVKNEGNITIASGTLTFTKDNIVSVSSTNVVANPTATGFTYNFLNLAAQQSFLIDVVMQVPTIPTVNLGQTLTNTVAVSLPTGDINPSNNNFSLTQTIVGSYDPNDKNEARGPKIVFNNFSANDFLTYTIRFENTGTANAETVKIVDVLDDKLDETSVKMVAASHNYNLIRTNKTLTWKFDGIELPPSVPNTTIGHGFVTFQIKPKTGYALGDVIPNLANIYFDFNPAIVTNTFSTEFVQALGNANFNKESFLLFPNPVQNILSIQSAKNITIQSIEVFDVLGSQHIIQKGNTNTIDVSALSTGIYFARIKSLDAESVLKFMKN
jgi:uncharacterized repeat protein (TIGR01451 family)